MSDISIVRGDGMSISSSEPQTRLQIQPEKILNIIYGIGMNVNLIIGSGIVTIPGTIWKKVKSPGIVLLLWLIGGIVAMSGSLSYVELGAIHKTSGGETKYLETAYPKPEYMMSYLFSFMYIFVIQPGMSCAILQSAAQYLWYAIKGYQFTDESDEKDTVGWKLPFSPFWAIKLTAVAMLVIITVYHMFSNKWANYINQTLAVIKLTTYSIIAIAGIYRLCTNPDSRKNWQSSNEKADISAYSTSMLLVMFSYNGWNTLNYSLDELKKPEKKLLYSNSISVLIVTIWYLLVNIAFISVVPKEDIFDKNHTDETIAGTFFNVLFSGSNISGYETQTSIAARIFAVLIMLSVMGTAASSVWSGSRVIVAAAKSNFFFPKYSGKLRILNKKLYTPINALFAQLVWCSFIIIFVVSSFPISSTTTATNFTQLLNFSQYSYWIFYLATGIGVFLIRRRIDLDQLPHMTQIGLYKVPLPIVGIFISAGIFILTFSFAVDDECPKHGPQNCEVQKIKQMLPFIISYAFLFIFLIVYRCWRRQMIQLYGGLPDLNLYRRSIALTI